MSSNPFMNKPPITSVSSGARPAVFSLRAVFLIAFALSCFLSCEGMLHPARSPAAHKGILDLRAWDFGTKGSVDLTGEWAFYWSRFLGPKDFSDGTRPEPSGYIRLPGVWKGYPLNGKILPGTGFATYNNY